MRVCHRLPASARRDSRGQRRVRISDQLLQCGFSGRDIHETMESLRPLAKLARRLPATQQQNAHERDAGLFKAWKLAIEVVLELLHSSAGNAHLECEAARLQF